jgi:outer membrane protein assembly factor BamB
MRLIARAYNSGFALAHDTYNGMGAASDGRIYYVLCSDRHDTAGQVYVFDPSTGQIRHLGDLTDVCGEKTMRTVSQGKSHVNFIESGGKLYFATHIGYYSIADGMEKMGIPPAGWAVYPGGHFLSYDLQSGRFEDLGTAPGGEGILTMNMDTERKRIYSLTWPTGRLICFDVRSGETKDLGTFFKGGENGKGAEYRTICRSLAIDPREGAMYFSTGEGTIHRVRYETGAVETVTGDDLRKDYFGVYDPSSPGHMAYNWRQVFWNPGDNQIYGVHGNSGYLFRFDPQAERI